MKEKTTWSPLARSLTPSPTSSTTPAPSWPSTSGSGSAIVPVIAERSEWHTPHAARRTVTSPRLGGSTLISSTVMGWLCVRQIAALALRAMGDLSVRTSTEYSDLAARGAEGFEVRPAQPGDEQLAGRRHPRFAVASAGVEGRGALLEEEGVRRKFHATVAQPIAERHLRLGERRAVIDSYVAAHAALVQTHHHPAIARHARLSFERIGEREAQRHVVALHQRARIDGCELEQHHAPL